MAVAEDRAAATKIGVDTEPEPSKGGGGDGSATRIDTGMLLYQNSLERVVQSA